MNNDIDTSNKFFVGASGDFLTVMFPQRTARMTHDEALNLAAWLVAINNKAKDFPALLEAINNT